MSLISSKSGIVFFLYHKFKYFFHNLIISFSAKITLKSLFQNCNSQVEDLIEAITQISQYVLCFQLVIPRKYTTRVTNELEHFNENSRTSISYQIEDQDDNPDFACLVIFNLGAMQKEAFLNGV